jgi:hypothetical protein
MATYDKRRYARAHKKDGGIADFIRGLVPGVPMLCEPGLTIQTEIDTLRALARSVNIHARDSVRTPVYTQLIDGYLYVMLPDDE